MKAPVKDFLNKPAPSGYVAGSLRGDTGFMTRPDLVHGTGLLATSTNFSDRSSLKVRVQPQQKQSPSSIIDDKRQEENGEDGEDEDDQAAFVKNDEEGLLAGGPRGAEDIEADSIYANIDAKMANRKKHKKTTNIMEEEKGDEAKDDEFKGLKKDLTKISELEWANLPESGDFRAKRLKKTSVNPKERYTPLPDNVVFGLSKASMESRLLSENKDVVVVSARERALGNKLDTITLAKEDVIMDGTLPNENGNFDPESYLRELMSKTQNTNNSQKTRTLLKNMINADKHNPDAWLMSTRLEWDCGNTKQARKLMESAIEYCPESESLWMYFINNIEPRDPSLLNRALAAIPSSLLLWQEAIKRQLNPPSKRKTITKALEFHPHNKDLWLALLNMEDNDRDTKISLLKKAIEFLPKEQDLWIELIELTQDLTILNNAKKMCQNSFKLTIMEIFLRGNDNDEIIREAITHFPNISSWIQVSFDQYPSLMEPVLRNLRIESLSDMESILKKDATIGKQVLMNFIQSSSMFKQPKEGEGGECDAQKKDLLRIIKKYIDKDSWKKIHEMLVHRCPLIKTQDFWSSLLLMTEEQISNDRLELALESDPTNEYLIIQAAKKYRKTGPDGQDKAIKLLYQANKTPGILSKLISITKNKDLALEATKLYPQDGHLWHKLCRLDSSRFGEALFKIKNYPLLWIEASLHAPPIRARAILEQARKHMPLSIELWIASIEFELQQKQHIMAKQILNQIIKNPTSPLFSHNSIILQKILYSGDSSSSGSSSDEINSDGDLDDGDFILLCLLLKKNHFMERNGEIINISHVIPKRGPKWIVWRIKNRIKKNNFAEFIQEQFASVKK